MSIVPQPVVDDFFEGKTTNLSTEIQAAFFTDESLSEKFSYAETQEFSLYVAQQLGLPCKVLEADEEGVGQAGDIILYNDEAMIASAKNEMERIWAEKTDGVERAINPSVLITAGSPGAGKTTLLYEQAPERFGADHVLIDPDEETLMKMEMYADLKERARDLATEDPKVAAFLEKSGKNADYFAKMMSYTAYRWLSNGMSSTMQNRAVEGRYNIALGTTSTGGAVGKQIDAYYGSGYDIDYLIVDAHKDTKVEANRIRLEEGNGKFVPKHDIENKADDLRNNLPLFFSEKVRSTTIYWREGPSENAHKMAQIGPGQGVLNPHWIRDWLAGCYKMTMEQVGLTPQGQKAPKP